MTGFAFDEAFLVILYPVLIVFARVGAVIMVMPALSSRFVTARLRLALALLLSMVLAPSVNTGSLPQTIETGTLVPLLLGETAVGLFMGLVSRYLLFAFSMAGQIIGQSIGLSNIFMLPGMGDEVASALSSLFAVAGVVLFLVADLHHLVIQAMAGSFFAIPLGAGMDFGFQAERLAKTAQYSFSLAASLAAPFLLLGFLFYLAVGLINRLMTSLPVFFISLPIALGGGIAVLMLFIAALVTSFVQGVRDGVLLFVQ